MAFVGPIFDSICKIKVNIPVDDLEYPIYTNTGTISASWNFESTDYFDWLEENCPDNHLWDWGEELVDGSMLVFIDFDNQTHANLFQEIFKDQIKNFEEYVDKEPKGCSSFYYHVTSWADDEDKYEREVGEPVNWCRENVEGKWYVVPDGEFCVCFCFNDEKDAMAFKLRWT